MDAKAKVVWPDNRVNIADPHELDARIVGFRIRPGHPWYGLGLSDPLFALGDAVGAAKVAQQAITDHEAALAEERELRISLESSWQQAEAQLFALIEKHAALLTGLEALAGELKEDSEDKDLSDVWRSACVYYAHRVGLLTTLTNSAKGGA